MDGERVGPLSYSVDAPEGETSAQRAILVGGFVITLLMFVSFVGGWFVLGVMESAAFVYVGGPLLILVAGIAAAWLVSRESVRQARKTALIVVTSMALLSAFFTNKVLANIKPALPQVRQTLNELKLPPGFVLVRDESFGDRLCRRGCPSIERTYEAPVNDPDPVSTLVLTMFAQGWERTSDVEPRFATQAQKDGLRAQLAENIPHIVELRVTRQ